MSNATVSTQVHELRNAGALATVNTGTMVIYADGTDIYGKDAAGNVYNLTHPTASSISMGLNNLTDVTIASVLDNQFLQYNSSTSQWENSALSLALNDLSNVSVASPSSNQVLQWDGSSWVAATISTGNVSALHNVGDVWDYSGTAPTSGYVLYWTGSEWNQKSVVESFTISDGSNTGAVDDSDTVIYAGANGMTAAVSETASVITVTYSLSAGLTNLSDTASSFTGLTSGQVLKYNGVNWSNSSLSINELSDVDIFSLAPTNGQALVWSSASNKFEPGTVSGTSSAGNQYQIQIADGSNGFAAADWSIDVNGHLVPASNNVQHVGQAGLFPLRVFVGHSGLYLAKSGTASSNLSDYATVGTDNANGNIIFTALTANSFKTYEFKGADNAPAKIVLESGSGINNFTMYPDPFATSAQNLKLPATIGVSGASMRISTVSGSDATMRWARANELEGTQALNANTTTAVDLNTDLSILTYAASASITLANGTATGQIKQIICTSAGSGNTCTLTPTSLLGFSTIVFNAVGDSVKLVWTGSGWAVTSNFNCTIS